VTDQLKKRLTGAVVLLLIGIIGWFWLLSADSPIDDVASETEIPPAPAFERFAVPEPQPPQDIDPAPEAPPPLPDDNGMGIVERAPEPVAAPRPAPAPSTPPIARAPAPAPTYREDAKGLPVAWALQVAALSNAAAADKLKADLAARGYKAYTRTGGDVTRVFVGPKLSREQAAADKQVIDKMFRVNSMIVRFQPE
jgi:DedD protein